MNKFKTILAASFLIVGLSSQACTLGAWDDNVSSTALAGGPAEAGANHFARYSGLCAMKTDGASPAVKNNGQGGATSGPAGEASMIVRFYFIANGAGTATLFQTYEDDAATTPVYTVNYDGTNVTVISEDGGTNAVAPVSASKNWHSVEISWAQGGAINLWVDVDANPIQLPGAAAVAADGPNGTGTSGNAATVINTAIMGDVTGVSTFTDIIFDAYESRRTTAIGRLLRGDGNGNATRSVGDAILIINESLAPTTAIAPGSADTNENGGNPTISDAIITLNLTLSNSL